MNITKKWMSENNLSCDLKELIEEYGIKDIIKLLKLLKHNEELVHAICLIIYKCNYEELNNYACYLLDYIYREFPNKKECFISKQIMRDIRSEKDLKYLMNCLDGLDNHCGAPNTMNMYRRLYKAIKAAYGVLSYPINRKKRVFELIELLRNMFITRRGWLARNDFHNYTSESEKILEKAHQMKIEIVTYGIRLLEKNEKKTMQEIEKEL